MIANRMVSVIIAKVLIGRLTKFLNVPVVQLSIILLKPPQPNNEGVKSLLPPFFYETLQTAKKQYNNSEFWREPKPYLQRIWNVGA